MIVSDLKLIDLPSPALANADAGGWRCHRFSSTICSSKTSNSVKPSILSTPQGFDVFTLIIFCPFESFHSSKISQAITPSCGH